jgi:hypothetical protein
MVKNGFRSRKSHHGSVMIKEVDMRNFGLIFAAPLALLVLTVAACGDDNGGSGSDGAGAGDAGGDFPAVSGGNVIPQEAVVDLNEGADPPFLYTQDFELQDCTFSARGKNAFFDSLEAGAYTKSELPGKIGEIAQKPVSYNKDYLVLAETKKLNIQGIGEVEAAIVQEREYENGKQIQVSFNWYSVCEQTGSVFSFGEDSFALNPETGEVTDTEGSWLAGYVNTLSEVSIPAMQIPGTATVGAKYIFDGAPGIALGGSEIVAHVNITAGKLATVPTKYYAGESDIPMPFAETAGDIQGCLQIEEISQDSGTRRPDLTDVTNKVWCPGFGLAYDTSDGWLLSATVLSADEANKLIQTIEDNQVRALEQ